MYTILSNFEEISKVEYGGVSSLNYHVIGENNEEEDRYIENHETSFGQVEGNDDGQNHQPFESSWRNKVHFESSNKDLQQLKHQRVDVDQEEEEEKKVPKEHREVGDSPKEHQRSEHHNGKNLARDGKVRLLNKVNSIEKHRKVDQQLSVIKEKENRGHLGQRLSHLVTTADGPINSLMRLLRGGEYAKHIFKHGKRKTRKRNQRKKTNGRDSSIFFSRKESNVIMEKTGHLVSNNRQQQQQQQQQQQRCIVPQLNPFNPEALPFIRYNYVGQKCPIHQVGKLKEGGVLMVNLTNVQAAGYMYIKRVTDKRNVLPRYFPLTNLINEGLCCCFFLLRYISQN